MPSKIDLRYKEIGGRHRASSRYAMILNRLKNTDRPKNAQYIGIELRIEREDFIQWFMANDFEGCSVDRIDPKGHYEFGNIRLIPTGENIAKDKLKASNGKCVCYSCKEEKDLSEFVKDSRRITTGRSTICKPCDVRRKK